MKKVVLLAALAVPMTLLAQKEVKPNLIKAEKSYKEGKYDEAKAIIDVTTASPIASSISRSAVRPR